MLRIARTIRQSTWPAIVVLLAMPLVSSDIIRWDPTVSDVGVAANGNDATVAGGGWEATGVASADNMDLGDRDGSGQVALFPSDTRYAPAVYAMDWTGDVDTELPLPERRAIPTIVRYIYTPSRYSATEIEAQLSTAFAVSNTILEGQRSGFVLELASTVPATSRPSRAVKELMDFSCTEFASLSTAVGYSDDHLNVYIVRALSSSSDMGIVCSEDRHVIVMTYDALPHVLAHEAGHALSLTHVYDATEFHESNVMWAYSDDRLDLTEGQTFRANICESSAGNTMLPTRLTTYDCMTASTSQVPSLSLSLWTPGE